MKRFYLLSACLFIAPSVIMAQYADNLDSELEQMYVESGNTMAPQNPPVNYDNRQMVPAQGRQYYPQNNGSYRVHEQPTTVIEATPLRESRADQIRQKRQAVEMQTELKIVERLEESRMADEQKRAQALFGNQFEQIQSPQPAPVVQQQVPVVMAPVVTQQQPVYQMPAQLPPQQEVVVAKPEPIAVEKAELVSAPKAGFLISPDERRYFVGELGFGEYPDAINVRGNYVIGAGIGVQTIDRFIFEGNFVYANYDIEDVYTSYLMYPHITNLDQYTIGCSVKYQLLDGRIHPVFGGLVNYSYRVYSDRQYYIFSNDSYSHAIDLGFSAGVDVEVSPRIVLGAELRYLMNIYSRASSRLTESFVNPIQRGTPLEQMNAHIMSFNMRFNY